MLVSEVLNQIKKAIDFNKVLYDTVFSSITRVLSSLNWNLDL